MDARQRMMMNAYQRYEAEKAAWVRLHQNSTPEQYEAAMKRIADECGV